MPAWLSSSEAAARLGVKRETLYAYVSRGVVTRRLADDGRRSEFLRRDIEKLAARSAPRRAARRGGTDITVATRISSIDDDCLFYRGMALEDIVGTHRFEDVAELLWNTPADLRPEWPTPRPLTLPKDVRTASSMDRVRVAVALSMCGHELRSVTGAPMSTALARHVIRACAAAVHPGTPPAHASTAALVAGTGATQRVVRAIDTAMVCMADHEMATSTLAARVAASTRADVPSVLMSGLGALAGSLHGSVSATVHRMLADAEAHGVAAAIETQARSGRVAGVGHKVYRRRDPRVDPVLASITGIPAARQRIIAEARQLIDERLTVPLNVDFALGALSYGYALPAETGEVVFSIARMAGWTAHALEEYDEEPLRFRGRALALHDPPPAR